MPVSLPRFIKKAFATDGLKTAIPDASDNATGRAGYDQGFPPINMQPQEAGGIPPDGTDMNGVIYDVTLAISYIQSGKSFPFNPDFATAIGGYQSGAVVSDSSNSTLWLNGVSNNTAFPAGWTNFSFSDPTETVRGSPLSATAIEAKAGSNTSKMISPSSLKAVTSDSSFISYGVPGTYIFTVPDILKSGAKKPYITVIGAGGSSPTVTPGTGAGAGGGGSSEGIVDLTGVSTVTVVVGGAAIPSAGGQSSFGSYMSATGGAPGLVSTTILPDGGIGSGGTFNRRGAAGGLPISGAIPVGGTGGGSPYSQTVPGSSEGIEGYFPGGGASIGSKPGGLLGAHGCVMIKW